MGAEIALGLKTKLKTDIQHGNVVDLSYSDYSPATLLADGYILDLTEYVADYMPNYSRLLTEDPDLAEYGYSYVDGEKRVLFLTNFNGRQPESFSGFCYRRDWIARYGTHPQTGEAFTGSWDENGIWTDNVIFPNGTDTPLYISDWEWMFEIITRALQDQGIRDGYCISLYYTGAMGSGELYTGFGGGCPWWYRTADGKAAYGGASENMRTFLTAMNNWWNQGWIDRSFAQRSGDMFYSIDSTTVHQGKVGMWIGRLSELGGAMDIDTEYTKGIMVCGAPQPINDLYGEAAQQNHMPDCLYAAPKMMFGVAVTTKALGKDLTPLFSFLDSLYDEERSNITYNGFSDRQLATMPEDAAWKQMYLRFGLENGIWMESDEEGVDGTYTPYTDLLLMNAMKGGRLTKYYPYANIRWTAESREPVVQSAIDNWARYPSTAYIQDYVDAMISPRNMSKKSKIDNNQRTYQAQTLPKFIMGEKGFDIASDTDWANYCKVIEKYGVQKVTEMYQEALDQMR